MLKIFLCDDNSESIKKYSELIARAATQYHIDIRFATFASGESLLFHLSEAPEDADIIYLDILMGKTNGVDTAKALRRVGCKAEIIFLTTSEDYVYDAFEVTPVQYLLKERTSQEKFDRVFLKAVELSTKRKRDVFV